VPRRKRILFVAEAITLAQMVRLAALSKALDRDRYDVHFASSQFPELVFENLAISRWPIWGLSSKEALGRIAKGKRLYSRRVLRRYIESDRTAIDAVKPDLIVGDLRWSLAVSAPVSKVPFASLINAYWSPFAKRNGFPLPEHPIVRLLGVRMAAQYFPRVIPKVFAHFAAPLNDEREQAGLPPIGSLLDVLTFGDHTLYADPPELVETQNLPSNHIFLGPVLWTAPGSVPHDWGQDPNRPAIYVTLGSSGAEGTLPEVLSGLEQLDVDVLLATAGKDPPKKLPGNVKVAAYVDGAAACLKARVVIHNGGSSTGYQALAAGRPVLGIPANFDQYLATERIDAAGAGLMLRSGTLRQNDVATAVSRLLQEPSFDAAAQNLGRIFSAHDSGKRFAQFVDDVVG
jgi:UDP:flavonoid glycosyltransferase YjiC (YdhE family)